MAVEPSKLAVKKGLKCNDKKLKLLQNNASNINLLYYKRNTEQCWIILHSIFLCNLQAVAVTCTCKKLFIEIEEKELKRKKFEKRQKL